MTSPNQNQNQWNQPATPTTPLTFLDSKIQQDPLDERFVTTTAAQLGTVEMYTTNVANLLSSARTIEGIVSNCDQRITLINVKLNPHLQELARLQKQVADVENKIVPLQQDLKEVKDRKNDMVEELVAKKKEYVRSAENLAIAQYHGTTPGSKAWAKLESNQSICDAMKLHSRADCHDHSKLPDKLLQEYTQALKNHAYQESPCFWTIVYNPQQGFQNLKEKYMMMHPEISTRKGNLTPRQRRDRLADYLGFPLDKALDVALDAAERAEEDAAAEQLSGVDDTELERRHAQVTRRHAQLTRELKRRKLGDN